jgi:hypothetical protein
MAKLNFMHQKFWIFLTAIILLGSILSSCKKGGGVRIKEQELKADSRLLPANDLEQPGDPSEKLFNGAWKIILAELNKYNWKKLFEMTPEDELEHELVLVKEFPASKGFNKILVVITFTNSSGYKCHGCLGRTSLFEFEQKAKIWQLKRKALAFSYGDEWGLEPEVMQILNLSPPRQYGVLVMTSFVSMGYAHETKYLYTFIKDKLKEVFSFLSFNSNAEGDNPIGDVYKYNTEMKLVKGKGKYFDIVLSSDGEFGNKESDNGKRFTFDGSKYVERKK